jgi:hypothetical protein
MAVWSRSMSRKRVVWRCTSDRMTWQRVGVVSTPGRVISQWGEFPVHEHDVCELP